MEYKPRESDGLNLSELIKELGDEPVSGGQNAFRSNLVRGLWNLNRKLDDIQPGVDPLNQDAIYVSKQGDDSNDGRNQEAPMLTIGAAITKAESLFTIALVVVLDSGTYTENVTLDTDTILYAPDIVFAGSITMGTRTKVVLYKHFSSADGQTLIQYRGSGGQQFPPESWQSYYKADRLDGSTTTYGGGDDVTLVESIRDVTFGGTLFMTVDYVICDSGTGFADSVDNPLTVHAEFKQFIVRTGIGILLQDPNSRIRMDVDWLYSLGTAIKITSTGSVRLKTTTLDADAGVFYDLGTSGNLWFDSQTAVGGTRIGTATPNFELSPDTVPLFIPSRIIEKTASFNMNRTINSEQWIGLNYRYNAAGGGVMTILDDSAYDPPWQIGAENYALYIGAGALTIRGEAGVTLNGNLEAGGGESDVVLSAAYKRAIIKKVADLTWDIYV